MADPLSVTARVVGITAATLHAIHILIQDIDNIKDAPEAISNITGDPSTVKGILDSLHDALNDAEGLSAPLKAQIGGINIENAVRSCQRACTDFQASLKHWMRHSTDDKTDWRDRLTVGHIRLGKIKALTQQLATCKATISMGLDTANFLNTCRQSRDTEAIIKLLQGHETEVNSQGALVVRQADEDINALERLSISGDNSSEDAQERAELLEEVKQGRELLEIYKKTWADATFDVHYERTGVRLKNIKVGNNGRAMVGFINSDGVEKRVDMDIQDVVADHGGRLIAGVANNISTDKFWD
ncbi:uncharacterized protein BDZ99DRAFT_449343 [Mytilinidion resinicola]|uniref:Azaphilone pigments biosynthesis cluster protein L N-terminal domain-containing protein n=1 Tax=Mytilinidion resinicola TaxID=574789 RepID=A0A6A6YDC7_9PEZI|nr:uncharacterized protein BDZ99DRAFT_449343 [Mytilinidion resinicola]KAF2806533.1 hypothetical protein BDZ99DRAFT_449343 [Mytilinidion resinicola]